MKRKIMIFFLCMVAILSFIGCNQEKNNIDSAQKYQEQLKGSEIAKDKKIKLGITLYSLKNEYTLRFANAAAERAKELGIELKIYDGNYDSTIQISQIEEMISGGVDGIILNPQDADACSPCVDKAVEAGIPIIAVNTRVNNDKITSYIGSQDVQAGEMIMSKVAESLQGKGKIVILEGPIGQSAQIERREGIQNILKKYPDIQVISEKTANWSKLEASTMMKKWMATFNQIDAVVAENDDMALGAEEVVQTYRKDILVVGIDGSTDALEAVENGKMLMTVFQDAAAQGRCSVDVLLNKVNGNDINTNYLFELEEVNRENVVEYKKRAQQ